MINVNYEAVNKAKYQVKTNFTRNKLQNAIDAALEKIDKLIIDMKDKFPSESSIDNVYKPIENDIGWGQGFWTGMLWLAYEATGKDKYKDVALSHLPSFRKRIEEKIGVGHHDMGFLYIPSCVAAYKLTGSEEGKETALLAADHLLTRYQEIGGFIQAWGSLGEGKSYRLIIDCLLNIPLLYWASEITGDEKYSQIAYTHYRTTIENAIRKDASTFHTYYFDVSTGKPIKGVTHQGASDDSCWARGQAWGIYGTILTKKYIDDPDAVDICKKLANHFLNLLPADYVPFWDLIFTDGNNEPRDSSSAAISVCGILELMKHLPKEDENVELYENAVLLLMESLYDNYSSKDSLVSNGLLLHAVYSKPSNSGVDECNIWGCYFYMEALIRLYKNWNLYW